MSKKLNVFLLDGLCMSPCYDLYLYKALTKYVNVVLGCITFHLERDFFKKNNVKNYPGPLDIVARLGIRSKLPRQVLKAVEYYLNLAFLAVRFCLRPIDIMHIQWLPLVTVLPFELWFVCALRRRGIKVVYTVHNVLPHDTGLKYHRIFGRVYQTVDALICHTEQARKELVSEFGIPEQKIWVIPHGPLFHDYPRMGQEEAKARLNLEENIVVMHFGSIRPYKGTEFLLQAWEWVAKAHPKAILLLAGNGEPSYLEEIQRLIARLDILKQVRCDFRYIPDEELPVYYQAADIVVYPYRDITQSGALLTGMAFGKAIVATAVGGFKETLISGKTGLLVSYGDVRELANALNELIDNPVKREQLGREVSFYLKQHYSWEAIAKKTFDCYECILRREKT
jgi:glycosyltransferase involved in cell wall biosynthesis